jgi:hypothetical protein
MGLNTRDSKKYVYLIDGSIRSLSTEQNPRAIKREFVNPTTKAEGVKWEEVYDNITGKISNVFIKEGKYGENLYIIFEKEQGAPTNIALQVNIESKYSEDLMKKLPNVDFNREVELTPFSFENDKGKKITGMSIYQTPDGIVGEFEKNKIKLESFFDDKEKKTKINGYPVLDQEAAKKYVKSDWTIYFLTARKFLIDYTMKNICSQFSGVEDEVEEGGGTIHDGPVADDNDIPADTIIFADAEPEVDPNVAKLAEIVALAKEKLKVATDAEVPMKVMEKTGKAYIIINYDAIIAELKSLK